MQLDRKGIVEPRVIELSREVFRGRAGGRRAGNFERWALKLLNPALRDCRFVDAKCERSIRKFGPRIARVNPPRLSSLPTTRAREFQW